MFNRWYLGALLVCWTASMSWLWVEKIWPTLTEGDRPQYAEVLPDVDEPPRRVAWEIQYRGRPIGTASNLSLRQADGSGRMESRVRFDDLPLGEIMSELLGALGNLLTPLWKSDANMRVRMVVESAMDIDSEGNLSAFTTDVRIADLPNVIRVEGEVVGAKLKVVVSMADEQGEMQTHYRDEIDLPHQAMVSGALSPQDRLTDLHVGQTWTMPVYRPFPPNSPVQMLQATVECHEVFIWNDQSRKAYQVVYRDDAGTGITIAREPIGRMWVREDGEVLQQQARVANMQFRFVRLPDEEQTTD